MRNQQNQWDNSNRSQWESRRQWGNEGRGANSDWANTGWNDTNYDRQRSGNYQDIYGNYGRRMESSYPDYDNRDYGNDFRNRPSDYGDAGYNSQMNLPYRNQGYRSNPDMGNYGEGQYAGNQYGSYSSDMGYNPDRSFRHDSSYRRRTIDNPSYGSRYSNDTDQRRNEDRDWWDRTSDQVASWFGDDEARRRREMDRRRDEGYGTAYETSYRTNRGKGPKNYKRPDERIREDVNDRLSDDLYVDASDIEVEVKNAEVTLTGTVDDRRSKRLAEDLAESVSGVANVENRIRVKSDSSTFNDTGGRTTPSTTSTTTATGSDTSRSTSHTSNGHGHGRTRTATS
jgi:osmotically-inducible protein OsmY